MTIIRIAAGRIGIIFIGGLVFAMVAESLVWLRMTA